MEVKPGYKQTEVGVIPEDWEVKQLADISDRIMVGIASAATFAYREKGVPLLRNQNIKSGYLDVHDVLYVDPAYELAFQNKRLRAGDLLTARTGYPGTTCVVPDAYDSAQSFTTLITRPRASVIHSGYLCHFINSEYGQRFFGQTQIGGAQKNVNAGTLRQMPIPVPPLPEQRAIADALSDVDALLAKLNEFIAKKRDLKQAAMQQLLTGQTRLPGFSGAWEVKRLGDIAEIVMGQSPSSSNYNAKGLGLPLIQGNADISQRVTIRRIFSTEITKRGKCGDILMSVRAPVGEISRAVFDVCLGRGVCAIRYPNDFLYHYLINIEPSWARLSKGSTFDAVNSADVKELEVSLPKEQSEQTAIATVLSDMDADIAALEARRDKTHDLKQGMMQELLTGRIRLV
ncbi:MAG: hypothetical protein RLZZ09_3664 [Pseudomonadota bacterium]|jgi:type I restriction enzyme S subunit